MVIVNILGGLGNQMFQYATAKALAHRLNTNLKLDITAFETYTLRNFELSVFNINASIASVDEIEKLKSRNFGLFSKLLPTRLQRKFFSPKSLHREKKFHFDPTILDLQDNVYLSGYWQTEKYFSDYTNELRKDFILKENLSYTSINMAEKIRSSNAVSLHIRRGDYISNRQTNDFHGVCSLEYYQMAVNYFNTHIVNCHFFIFSDDLDWARENLTFIKNISFVDLDNAHDYEEILLMSQCQHNIIANSSFSWWGAWLNENPDKVVIAPKKWFADSSINTTDLIPNSWIRL